VKAKGKKKKKIGTSLKGDSWEIQKETGANLTRSKEGGANRIGHSGEAGEKKKT